MASKYDEERKRISGSSSSNTSKYASERDRIKSGSSGSDAQHTADILREARSKQSKITSAIAHEPRETNEQFLSRVRPADTLIKKTLSQNSSATTRVDQSKEFNEDLKANQAERERVSRESTQGSAKAQEDALTPYERWYKNSTTGKLISKLTGGLQKADRAVSNAKAGALDTATIGATQGLGREAIKNIPDGKENLQPLLNDRLKRTSYKTGQIAGYLAPGVAADRLVAKVGGKALENLPSVVQGLIRGSASGALDSAAQEVGDVAFREGKFDPVNVALGAGIGGGLGAAVPAVGGLIKKLRGSGNRESADAVESAVRNEPPQRPLEAPQPERIEEIPSQSAQEEPIKQNWFTRLFGDQGVGISATGQRSGSGRPVNSEDVIVNNAIRKDKGSILDTATAKAKETHRNLVDKLEDLKRGGLNVYEAGQDASRSNQIANQLLGKEFVTPEGIVVGEGMESIFKSVPRGRDKTLLDYLIVKDAQARVPRGERVFDENIKVPDPADRTKLIPLNSEAGLSSRLAELERQNPWLPKMSDRWNAFTGNLRQYYGVNEGLISEDMSRALLESRPNYIKMLRQFDKSEKPGRKMLGRSSGDTFTGLKAPIKSVSKTGSARNIVDSRKTMAESVGAWVNNAMRNRTGQALVNNILNDPEAFQGIARIVPETAEATQKSLKEINDILKNDGIDGLAERMNKEFEIAFKKGSQSGGKDNVITVMVNGNPVKVEILQPDMALAFQGMNPTQLGLVMQIAKAGSDLTKRSATGVFAPVFAAKSAVVDLPVALIQAKGNRLRFLADYTHALGSGLGNKLGIPRLKELARDYERAGGGYSSSMKGEKSLNKTVKNLERNPILSGKNLLRQGERLIKAPFKISEEFSNVFENAPRIAAAKGELRRLGGQRTPENVRKSMQEGREVTVNYSRRGRMTDELEALSPYTNAAIQGVTRMGRQFAKKPFQTIAGVSAVVGIPKAYEYIQFHDDPDYQQISAREKFRNLIIKKNSDGTFTKIPLEPSYAAFGAATLDFLQYVKDKDPNALKGMSDALANAYLPPLASGALQGLTQGAEGNKSAIEKSGWGLANATSFGPAISTLANQGFTGAPIDSAAVADRSPRYRYDEKTSSVAKYLGDKMNFSPMKTDYILKQYGGDLARFVLPVMSDVGSGTKQQTLLRNFIVDPTFTNNLTNDFYMGKSLIDAAYRDNEEVDAKFPKWYSEDLREYISSTKKGSVSKQLSELSASKKEVQQNKSLTAEEKAMKLRDIQRRINNIYIDVNSRLEDAGVPLPRR